MSDINHSRMIPLHIADQAVAACEKEIAQLKAENARLRASSFVTAVPVEQYERVIKAGDAMADAMDRNGCHDNGDYDENVRVTNDWNAAKEGKQP